MKKSLLKKMVTRKEVHPVLRTFIERSGEPVTIFDPDGSSILGKEPGAGERFPLTYNGEAIGHIQGDGDAVHLASLLNYILEVDAQAKSIAQHVLEKYKEVTMLYDFSEKVGTCLDPREVAKLVIEESRHLIFADVVFVTIRDEASGVVERFLPSGQEDALSRDDRLASLANLVWEKAEIVNEIGADSRLEAFRGLVSSLMLAPLKIKDRVFGCIIAFSRVPYSYSAEDLKMLVALASPAAATMEVALLFDRLKRSEESYRDLFDGINDAVLILDPEGRLRNVNRTAVDQLRHQRHDLLGMTVSNFIPSESEGAFQEMMDATVKSGRAIFESNFLRKDGSVFPVEIHLRTVEYQGETALLGVARDITERRRVEEEIRWKEALLRAMTSASPLAFYVVDNRTDAILYFNRRFVDIWKIEHMTGQMKRSEVANREVMELCFPALVEADGFRKSWEPLQSENNRTVVDEEFLTTDGRTLRHFSGQIRDERFNYFGRLHIFEDITERKRVEAALKHRMEMERLVIGISSRFMNLTLDYMDMEINRSLEILGQFTRAHICQIFQSSPDGNSLMRTHCWSAGRQDPGDPVEFSAEEAAWWLDGLRMENHIFLRTMNDLPEEAVLGDQGFPDEETESLIAVPMIYQERCVGILTFEFSSERRDWMAEDIAFLRMAGDIFINALEREKAVEALREERALLARRVAERTAELSTANVELARASRMKDQFLANMSHELRTPLNAILGLAEALQEQTRGPLNERQLHSLRTIEESGRHLLSLINDILDLSKIEAGKMEFNPQPILTEAVCQASLRIIRQAAAKKHISVDFEMDGQVMTITADDRRLKQILVNLLTNAVKFTPEGGSIGLNVSLNENRDRVVLTVWDTGIGIPREHLGDLFKPFVQVDSSLSRRYEGTGLGLALVASLVEIHGGTVEVESDVGKGSRFRVALPWQKAKTQSAVDESPGARETRPAEAPAPEPRPEPSLPDYAEDTLTSIPEELKTIDLKALARPVSIVLGEDNEANIQTLADYLSDKGCKVVLARNGLEIIKAATEDKPDLILMDVHLPVLDGLETTRRLRKSPTTSDIPIIAVTSLAMTGDRERCLKAGVNQYLSKPVKLRDLLRIIEGYAQQREGGRS
ncbi:MAG: PAS domain S-box protein [Acidobacteria bacterium]|nr:PAS domain S-box protein [Acidobacteriota bacterium]